MFNFKICFQTQKNLKIPHSVVNEFDCHCCVECTKLNFIKVHASLTLIHKEYSHCVRFYKPTITVLFVKKENLMFFSTIDFIILKDDILTQKHLVKNHRFMIFLNS